MTCKTPLDIAVLADYWAAALPQSEEEAIEEHVFACDECGALLYECITLARSIQNLVRQGALLMVVSDTLVKRFAEEGARVRQYAPPVGGRIACTVTAEDDFLIGRLTADLRGATRIDLCICDERGAERLRLADIPFDSDSGGVTFQQSITYAKAAPSETMIARLVSSMMPAWRGCWANILSTTRARCRGPAPGSWRANLSLWSHERRRPLGPSLDGNLRGWPTDPGSQCVNRRRPAGCAPGTRKLNWYVLAAPG